MLVKKQKLGKQLVAQGLVLVLALRVAREIFEPRRALPGPSAASGFGKRGRRGHRAMRGPGTPPQPRPRAQKQFNSFISHIWLCLKSV